MGAPNARLTARGPHEAEDRTEYHDPAMTDPSPSLATPYRTHTAGQLRAADAGTEARLAGWVHRRRDHGQLIFLDLRDRHGITQVVVDKADAPDAHATASRVRSEFVIAVRGTVAKRQPGTENPRLPTGDIELQTTEFEILSEAKTTPFYINEPDAPVDEGLRLKYRYLDIRRQPMADRLLLRSRMVQAIREVHHANGFVEVETPTLIKSTPEGARDFIVPSRLQPGSVYALPQSPQQLKQLLMVAGIDRYFQIARCYRDEDLRGDRQPEFTQLDLEMSFVDEETVMAFIEGMAIEVSNATTPERPLQQVPFPRFTYDEVIERFGSDKPDVRFGMELVDLAPALTPASGFKVFDEALAAGGRVKAIVAPGMAGITRREIDELTERARRFGAKGLAYLALEPGGEIKSPIAKFLSDDAPTRDRRAERGRGGRPHPDRGRRRSRHRRRAGTPPRGAGRTPGSRRPERPGLRLGQSLPDVQVGRGARSLGRDPQPVQRRGPRGRGAARDGVRGPGQAIARRPRRPSPRAPVRPGAERLGARWRVGADPPARPAGAKLPAAGPDAGRDARQVRGGPRRVRVRRAATRWDRPRDRSLGGAPGPADEHPRGHGLPQDPVGQRPDARGALGTRSRSSSRSSACGSWGCRRSRSVEG